ncbi:ABC transporter permease [Croceimicrobium sp.]|uniref:ABC transporter permease n=1 Tax=Croceimicrobium sp. TaxID=2828340 RepID=UPI003BAB7724
MRILKFLLQKEFKQIFRNRSILAMILMMPVVQLLIMPLAADYEIKNIHIALVDLDKSPYSEDLQEAILASGYFISVGDFNSFEEANQAFEKGTADLILEIPAHFEKEILDFKKTSLNISANAINGVKATVGSAYLNQVINRFAQKLQANISGGIQVESLNWYNPFLNYQAFMVPGILVLLVTMVGVYMTSLNIVKEKEVGTIEQINVSPIKKYHFILGKLIPFLIIGFFVFSLGLFGVARLVYGIVPIGSLLALYSFLFLYLIAVLGIGMMLSTYAETQQQAMSLAFFIMMIFILMGGLFTAIESMPEWAQWVAALNPVTYFIEVVRLVVLKGSGFKDLLPQFGIIALMALISNSWAILNYRKTT